MCDIAMRRQTGDEHVNSIDEDRSDRRVSIFDLPVYNCLLFSWVKSNYPQGCFRAWVERGTEGTGSERQTRKKEMNDDRRTKDSEFKRFNGSSCVGNDACGWELGSLLGWKSGLPKRDFLHTERHGDS